MAGIIPGLGGAKEQGLGGGEERLPGPADCPRAGSYESASRSDKAKLDHERIAFQSEKDDLLHELEQALADKAEAEKQADEDVRGCRRRSRFSSS